MSHSNHMKITLAAIAAAVALSAAPLSGMSPAVAATSAPPGTVIPESQYSIASFDSQSPAYPAPPSLDGTAKAAIDGDVNTEWTSLATAMPHWLAVDLGATYNVTGLEYSVKNQSNGPIQNYKVFATNNVATAQSTTGDWGQPVATGAFTQPNSNTQVQSVSFNMPVTARFIKLEADSTVSGSNYAAISEISAFTSGAAVAPPPYGVTVGTLGPWSNPDDTSASPFIDKDGTFHYESAHSLYGLTDSRSWSFNTGDNLDTAVPDAAINQAVSPTNPADKNSDTTERCNNSPTGLTATFAPAGSNYAQRDYCDLTQLWVDPDTGNWYGLVHNEFTPQPFGDGLHFDAIDFAVSADQGKTWTIKNQVITTPFSTVRGDTSTFPQQTYDYGDGDPRLFVDTASGYFYMYYGSRIVDKTGSWAAFYEHVARAPIADKMAPGSWSKYYDGSWQQPGLGGKESNLVPVSPANTTGYTPTASEYNPLMPGTASVQIAAGLMPATSPLFVMDVTYDAYLGLYIGEPQNPDQSGNAPQQYYATKSLATPKWTLLGDTGSYTTASWYRWFIDPANATSSNIVGKSFRSYCSFGCSNGSASEYANVTIDQNAAPPAPVIDTSKSYTVTNGLGLALAQQGGSSATKIISSTSAKASAAWTFTSNGDGSYSLTNAASGDALGVSNDTAGRAWGTNLSVTPTAKPGQTAQQWFVIPGTTPDGTATGNYRVVNRYSGLVISLPAGSGQALTTPFRSWTDSSGSTVGNGAQAAAQTLTLTPLN